MTSSKRNSLRFLAILTLLIIHFASFSQEKEPAKWGKVSGQWRTFYMSTTNKGDLQDFQALATGGNLAYSVKLHRKVKFGAALYSSYNLGLQDLSDPDPTTNRLSRYELGLFDVADPKNDFILFPGELFFQFDTARHHLTVGRMKFKSPFINPQDGRMIPTLVQGLNYRYEHEKLKFQLGLINEIASRSTDGFRSIGNTIGEFPVGRQSNGQPSLYAGNTQSDFITFLNLDYTFSEKLKSQFWNYYVDNVFNTSYLKPTFRLNETVNLSMEWLHQRKVGEGGNRLDSLSYVTHNTANVVGAQVAIKQGKTKISVGYDHILSGGRFLFPREWGREFLFSFQKRERSEGASASHALVMYLQRSSRIKNSTLDIIYSVGHHWKSGLRNPEANKYAQPDYYHINVDMSWEHDTYKRLQPGLLLTYKMSSEDTNNPNFIFNKTDMFQVNFVVNYNF